MRLRLLPWMIHSIETKHIFREPYHHDNFSSIKTKPPIMAITNTPRQLLEKWHHKSTNFSMSPSPPPVHQQHRSSPPSIAAGAPVVVKEKGFFDCAFSLFHSCPIQEEGKGNICFFVVTIIDRKSVLRISLCGCVSAIREERWSLFYRWVVLLGGWSRK